MKKRSIKSIVLHYFFVSLGFVFITSCTNQLENVEDVTQLESNNFIVSKRVLSANEISVTANGDDGNKPINTLDGNLNTRWSSKGITGKYITYDLGETRKVDEIKIAWYKGDQRVSYFQVAIGNSTSSFQTVLNRKTNGSSGTSNDLEKYELPDTEGRYVRIRGFGNSSNDWNSITEVQIITTDQTGPPNSVVVIPAKIEAENYSNQQGTQVENTADSGGGKNVGYIDTGDFLEYEINVPETKDYNFEFRVASLNKTVRFDVLSNGNYLSSISKESTFGWQNWITTKKTIRLNQGTQTIRLLATDGGWNINWLQIKEASSNPGNGDSPAAVLGGLVNWKLNGYSGTFNLGASNNGLSYVDKTPNLSSFSNPNWFYTDGSWTFFKAYTGNPTSSGSGNQRSELLELTAN